MRSGPQGWRAGAETIAGREGAGVGGWGPPVITTALLTHARNSHQRSHAVPYTLPLLPPSGAELPSAPILGTHLGLTVVPTDTESSRLCSVKVPAWDCTLLVPPVLRWDLGRSCPSFSSGSRSVAFTVCALSREHRLPQGWREGRGSCTLMHTNHLCLPSSVWSFSGKRMRITY